MPTLNRARSTLLLIDLQERLMPAIAGGAEVVANTRRLLAAAEALEVPVLATTQNPRGLGDTVPELTGGDPPLRVLPKMTFDACGDPAIVDALPAGGDLVVAGCEAHVCVLQTVLGLLGRKCTVAVVADAIGSRAPANRDAALRRMERAGAEIVTTEMVVFEWLGTAEDPRFKSVVALLK